MLHLEAYVEHRRYRNVDLVEELDLELVVLVIALAAEGEVGGLEVDLLVLDVPDFHSDVELVRALSPFDSGSKSMSLGLLHYYFKK